MHYAEIKMAESMSTPTISPRNPICRLCGDSHESHYMLRIFSKAGSSVHKNIGRRYEVKGLMQGLCFFRQQDGTVYSESPIHREYAVGSKLRICCKAMRSPFTFFASAVEAFINKNAV